MRHSRVTQDHERHRRRPVVLMNVMKLTGNPYLDQWCRAAEAGGADLRLLSWRRALARGSARPDWVHLQWPERSLQSPSRGKSSLSAVRLLLAPTIARLRGAKVLVTAHNVTSHEAQHPNIERLLWWALARLITDVHLMTASGSSAFFEAHRGLRNRRRHVIPHGDYTALVTASEAHAARRSLGLPDSSPTLITFGALRGYKGVDELLDAWCEPTASQHTLIIAGRILDGNLADRLRDIETTTDALVVRDGFLSDDELALHVSAADWVVLPYRQVLNSGSLLLALSLARPVVVPDTPTFREIASRVGAGWVVCYSGRLTGELLGGLGSPPSGRPDLDWCSWDRISQQLADLFAAT